MQDSTKFRHTQRLCCCGKDLDKIKQTQEQRGAHNTPEQLKKLVEAAQRREQPAIDKLCEDFAPLIYKEARRANVRAALGEDAVNIAWEIFLRFIYKYEGNNFRLLPGLVQLHLRYRLLDELQPKGCRQECCSLEAQEEWGNLLADERDVIAQSELRVLLERAMETLGAKQRAVITELFFYDSSLQACSEKYGLTKQSCYVYKKRALGLLRKAVRR